MAQMFMLYGLAGSGKSTFVKREMSSLPIVSRDIIRAELGFTSSADEKKLLSRECEGLVTKRQNELIRKYCEEGQSFVLDNQNNRRCFRLEIEDIVRQYPDMAIVLVRFHTPLDVCIERRKGQIAPEIMKKMYDSFEEPTSDEYDAVIDAN